MPNHMIRIGAGAAHAARSERL